jgi:hypothetical protein
MADGGTLGILGALSAFPRRLAAREVARQGFALRGATGPGVSHLVFGRRLLDRMTGDDLAGRLAAARKSGKIMLSENGFRRHLGLITRPQGAGVSRSSLIEQSKLDGLSVDLLSLFDAFESDSEPYTFRDVILARKYQKLVASGTSWADIARSVHRTGNVASITALALHSEGKGIFVRDGERLSEIDGQGVLPFGADEDPGVDDLFTEAEAAEAAGDHVTAAELYGQYLAVVPGDPVAAFNRANALAASGSGEEAGRAYALAIKLDPTFAEAWFNFGTLHRDAGKHDLAREHFARAVALDPRYADPLYNLAALEYDAGHLTEARQYWTRYLELDDKSEWAKKAMSGIKLIDMTLNAERKRGA